MDKEHYNALRFVRRLMRWALVLPPRSQHHLNLIYTIGLLTYFIIVLSYRLFGKYHVIYDEERDYFSTCLDLCNYVALIVGHGVVAFEIIWKNHMESLNTLHQIRSILWEQFQFEVNDKRIKRYCNIFNLMISIRVVSIWIVAYHISIVTQSIIVIIFNLYSDLVFTLRFGEINLQLIFILLYFLELKEAGEDIAGKLNGPRSNLNISHTFGSLREIHRLLWKSQREIEIIYSRSLNIIIWKYFVDACTMPYWVYINFHLRHNFSLVEMQFSGYN